MAFAAVVERWKYVVAFCSEEIVMWRCGEEVEVACNGVVPAERERFSLKVAFVLRI